MRVHKAYTSLKQRWKLTSLSSSSLLMRSSILKYWNDALEKVFEILPTNERPSNVNKANLDIINAIQGTTTVQTQSCSHYSDEEILFETMQIS